MRPKDKKRQEKEGGGGLGDYIPHHPLTSSKPHWRWYPMPYIFKGMCISLLSGSDTDGDRTIQHLSLPSPSDVALQSVLNESELEKKQNKILLNTIITSSVFVLFFLFLLVVFVFCNNCRLNAGLPQRFTIGGLYATCLMCSPVATVAIHTRQLNKRQKQHSRFKAWNNIAVHCFMLMLPNRYHIPG